MSTLGTVEKLGCKIYCRQLPPLAAGCCRVG